MRSLGTIKNLVMDAAITSGISYLPQGKKRKEKKKTCDLK